MKRMLLFGILMLYIIPTMYGQTYYYQLTKKVSNNVTTTNVSGGQFITFMADICYESTKNGLNVGNGTLTRKSKNAQFKEYKGDSYWGTATFKFKSDLSKLNVITSDGELWVYTRTTAPSSATTCSLIRAKNVDNNPHQQENYPPTPQIINNNTIIHNHNHQDRDIYKKEEKRSKGIWVTKDCTACKGTGKSPIRRSSGNLGGVKKYYYCDVCNGYYAPHYHETCGVCKGKGTVQVYQYKN
ncbi:MAG: hypothetical protein IKJ10_03565 [Bacteroidaceae bacterium]|nr:hypothetical protein [Bacteroidaceae bacterium]